MARARATLTTPPAPVYSQTRDAFMQEQAPGCLEYYEAIGPNGLAREVDPRERYRRCRQRHPLHARRHQPVAPAAEVDRRRQRAGAGRTARSTPYRKRLSDRRLSLPFFNLQQVVGASVVELTLCTAITAANAQGKEPPAGATCARRRT